ncbi:MAG: DUF4838 domain-containing protein [Chitinophagaceae bacterium]
MQPGRIKTSLILLLSAALLTGAKKPEVAELKLTVNGKPNATIVRPTDATPRENLAAEELQKYIQKISGAVLPIKSDNEKVKGSLILIGGPERNKYTEEVITREKFDISVPGPEGFMIKTFGNNKLLLAGSSKNPLEYERGTLYAVYEFLEANLGCSFSAYGKPGSGIGEFVPVKKTVKTGPIDYTQAKADVSYRSAIISHYKDIPFDHGLGYSLMDWLIKNRYNRILTMSTVYEAYKTNGLLAEAEKRGIAFTVGHHEASTLFLPPDGNKYFPQQYHKTHPDYYKLLADGNHYYSQNIWGGQMIFDNRNEDAIQEISKNIIAWLNQNPYVDMVCLWPNDHNDEQCMCPKCAPYSKAANYTYFANEVAKLVKKEHPHKKIDILIYGDVWAYPGIVLDPSIVVNQANWNMSLGMRPYGKSDGSSLIGTAWEANAKRWSKSGAPIVYYEYYMGSYGWDQLYFPMADEFKAIYGNFKADGYAIGSGTQIECYNLWNFLFNFYMHGRTAYNTSTSLTDHLDRFVKIFGEGALPVKSYLLYAEGLFEGQARAESMATGDRKLMTPGKWFAENADKKLVYKYFEDAYNNEPEGSLKDNIRMLRMAFRYTDLYVNGGGDGELKYMQDHFDSYSTKLGYGITIKRDWSGSFTPDKWYKFSK